MPPLIEQHLEASCALAAKFGVRRLEVCGSIATSEFDPARSDVDFLVEYPEEYDFGPRLKRSHEPRRELSGLPERPVEGENARSDR